MPCCTSRAKIVETPHTLLWYLGSLSCCGSLYRFFSLYHVPCIVLYHHVHNCKPTYNTQRVYVLRRYLLRRVKCRADSRLDLMTIPYSLQHQCPVGTAYSSSTPFREASHKTQERYCSHVHIFQPQVLRFTRKLTSWRYYTPLIAHIASYPNRRNILFSWDTFGLEGLLAQRSPFPV